MKIAPDLTTEDKKDIASVITNSKVNKLSHFQNSFVLNNFFIVGISILKSFTFYFTIILPQSYMCVLKEAF